MKKILRKIPGFNYGKKIYYGFDRTRRRIRNILAPTAHILLYHRVATVKEDPHLLCVSPENFRAQIKFLKENFKIIPLVKLVQDVREGKVEKNSIVITFDDGYVDNLYNALPILEEFKVPATIFLTTGYICPPAPVNPNKAFRWEQNTPTDDQGRPMAPEEAKRLATSRLIEIGGHTISHPKLAKLPEIEQFREISESKEILEKALNIHLMSFAYPFGSKDSFNKKTVDLVKKAGYHYACANIHERVTNRSDIYAMPRFISRNWDTEEFKAKFKNFI